MKNPIISLCFALIMLISQATWGQDIQIMSLQLDPGRIAANHGKVQIMNHKQEAVQVVMSLQVLDLNRSILLERNTDAVVLQTGLNIYDLGDVAEAVRQLSSSSSESRVPAEICLEILGGGSGSQTRNGSLLATSCEPIFFPSNIASTLLYPFDDELIPNSNIIFTWVPMRLSYMPTHYTLTVVELPSDVPQANLLREVLQRPAHFQQQDIMTSLLVYPSHAPRLEAGKSYAWFVQVTNENQILSNTEIRRFSVAEENLKQSDEEIELSFVDLDRRDENHVYPAKEKLRFKFPNRYDEAELTIKIKNSQGEKMKIASDWLTDLGHGLYELRLPLSGGFEPQAIYEMTIRDTRGASHRLQFQYFLQQRTLKN